MSSIAFASAAESKTLGLLCAVPSMADTDDEIKTGCDEIDFCVYKEAADNTTSATCEWDSSIECENAGLTYKESAEALIACGPSSTECKCKDEIITFWAATFNLFGLEDFSEDSIAELTESMSNQDEMSDALVQYMLCTEHIEESEKLQEALTASLFGIDHCGIDAGDVEDKMEDLASSAAHVKIGFGFAMAAALAFTL